MQKTIRVLAILATVLVAASLVLMVATMPLQRIAAAEIYGMPASVVACFPQLPVAQIVSNVLMMVVIGLLIICCGNKRGGIWMELILLAVMLLALPLISWAFPLLHDRFVVFVRGDNYVAAHTLVNRMVSVCMAPSRVGYGLALVAGGMSIAFKRMSKKM